MNDKQSELWIVPINIVAVGVSILLGAIAIWIVAHAVSVVWEVIWGTATIAVAAWVAWIVSIGVGVCAAGGGLWTVIVICEKADKQPDKWLTPILSVGAIGASFVLSMLLFRMVQWMWLRWLSSPWQ